MAHTAHSDTYTEGVRVRAAAEFTAADSDPESGRFVYQYGIRITNEGDERVKLLSRHWIIVDANGRRQDVKGPGVVGQYPDLAPGETFEYVSHCPLRTKWGTMEGSYTMEREDGDRFLAAIGRFFLVPTAPPLPLAH